MDNLREAIFIRNKVTKQHQIKCCNLIFLSKTAANKVKNEVAFNLVNNTKVRELKRLIPSAFLPLVFDLGEAMQIDWGKATVYLRDVRAKVHLFCARLCYSCRPVVLSYHRQNEESFLDAFVCVFRELNGAPVKVIFDNGKVAVKDGYSDPML